MRAAAAIGALVWVLWGCGANSSLEIGEAFSIEELDDTSVERSQDIGADLLVVRTREGDVAPGTLSSRFAKVFTSADAAKMVLGGGAPTIDFGAEWLVGYRPDVKTATSRVSISRAQLSATGKTLSLWATVTEPASGCAPWLPNEVALISVPSREVLPSSVRVYLSRVTGVCELVTGPDCSSSAACPSTTPMCLGALEQGDGALVGGRCVKLPPSPSAGSCSNDAQCGARAFCAGLSLGGQGVCVASWMRGTFSVPETGRMGVVLPQGGGWLRTHVVVTGLATVPMDAWVQLYVDGAPASRIEWKLSKGYGSPPPLMRVGQFGARVPVPVPGDEAVNADWLLEVRDLGVGNPGHFRGARLSLTSRWD